MKQFKKHPRTYKNPYRKMLIELRQVKCGTICSAKWVHSKEEERKSEIRVYKTFEVANKIDLDV